MEPPAATLLMPKPIDQRPTPSPSDRQARSRGRAYGVAMELAGSIIGMALIGWLIDRWQNSSPRWTLILTGLGAVGGFYNFLKKALALNREEAAAYKAAHPNKSRSNATAPTTPDLFPRSTREDSPDTPDFDVPPDLEDEIERRTQAWDQQARKDIND